MFTAIDFNDVGYLGTFCCVERLPALSAGAVFRGGFSVVYSVPYGVDEEITVANILHGVVKSANCRECRRHNT